MKKTHANWDKEIYLRCDCPYCGSYQNIVEEFEPEYYFDEFDEDSLEGKEITCIDCGKEFGLTETING